MRSRGSARLWAKAMCGKEALLPEALFGYFLVPQKVSSPSRRMSGHRLQFNPHANQLACKAIMPGKQLKSNI